VVKLLAYKRGACRIIKYSSRHIHCLCYFTVVSCVLDLDVLQFPLFARRAGSEKQATDIRLNHDLHERERENTKKEVGNFVAETVFVLGILRGGGLIIIFIITLILGFALHTRKRIIFKGGLVVLLPHISIFVVYTNMGYFTDQWRI